MKTTTKDRIAKLNKSIALQERTRKNLDGMQWVDGGEAVKRCDEILTILRGRVEFLKKMDK